jgi:zinc protease
MPVVERVSGRRLRHACGLALAIGVLTLPTSATMRPPTLDYRTATLANGLRVVVHEDHSTPIVNVQVWYHVGSRDERRGRAGFAHLFEHLMFKGSRNVPADQHTSWLTGIGGQCNAYTTEDVTVYWDTVPAHQLPLPLWLEADRMASLRIDRTVLDHERGVVKEERRTRIENQPYGRLSEIIYEEAFTAHPYEHSIMGSMHDLDTASVDDVREFYRTFYVPNNATVAIAGDVDTATAMDLVAKYFGPIPASPQPVPRDLPAEPAVTAPRRVTIEERWPLPVVVLTHHAVADGHPDSYALQVAGKILSDGQSSRIYRRLVYTDGVALAAFGGGNLTEDPNLFFAVAVVQPGRAPADAEAALAAELDRLRQTPVSDRELMRAKNQFTRDLVAGRVTIRQKAAALARAVVIHDDVTLADRERDLFQRVTAADVQRVARTYLAPDTRLTITVLPRVAPIGGRP